MTAETFLEQYGDTTATIKRKQQLKENCEALAGNITSHLTPDKVQSSGSLQKMAEATDEALDLANEIKELFILKNKVRKEIESVLNQISGRLRGLLYEKYLLLTSEETIAKQIDRSEDTVDRLIKEGQAEVQRILDEKYGDLPQNAEEYGKMPENTRKYR